VNFSPDPANAADLAACIGTLSYRELSQAALAAEMAATDQQLGNMETRPG
jgi:hypothetical protein